MMHVRQVENRRRHGGTPGRVKMHDTDGGASMSVVASRRIAELERFVTKHQRLPHRSGPPMERSLMYWMERVRARGRVEVRAELDRRVPGWDARLTRKTSEMRIAELEQFVAEHQRLPRGADRLLNGHCTSGCAVNARAGEKKCGRCSTSGYPAGTRGGRKRPRTTELPSWDSSSRSMIAFHARRPRE